MYWNTERFLQTSLWPHRLPASHISLGNTTVLHNYTQQSSAISQLCHVVFAINIKCLHIALYGKMYQLLYLLFVSLKLQFVCGGVLYYSMLAFQDPQTL